MLINKKYQIIYADPPWLYRDKASAGNRGASFKYDVQDHKWICGLPVENISDDNCVLFLWITMPQLPNVFEVIKEWGFVYKTCAFTWVKRNKLQPSWFWGMGNWTRANSELCLLATKGKPKRVSKAVKQLVVSERREHSRKPDRIRNDIVELCGDVSRIELFARQKVEGWDSYGNEI